MIFGCRRCVISVTSRSNKARLFSTSCISTGSTLTWWGGAEPLDEGGKYYAVSVVFSSSYLSAAWYNSGMQCRKEKTVLKTKQQSTTTNKINRGWYHNSDQQCAFKEFTGKSVDISEMKTNQHQALKTPRNKWRNKIHTWEEIAQQ